MGEAIDIRSKHKIHDRYQAMYQSSWTEDFLYFLSYCVLMSSIQTCHKDFDIVTVLLSMACCKFLSAPMANWLRDHDYCNTCSDHANIVRY